MVAQNQGINYENNLPIKEHQAPAFKEDMAFVNRPGVNWLDIDGVHQAEILEAVGAQVNPASTCH